MKFWGYVEDIEMCIKQFFLLPKFTLRGWNKLTPQYPATYFPILCKREKKSFQIKVGYLPLLPKCPDFCALQKWKCALTNSFGDVPSAVTSSISSRKSLDSLLADLELKSHGTNCSSLLVRLLDASRYQSLISELIEDCIFRCPDTGTHLYFWKPLVQHHYEATEIFQLPLLFILWI